MSALTSFIRKKKSIYILSAPQPLAALESSKCSSWRSYMGVSCLKMSSTIRNRGLLGFPSASFPRSFTNCWKLAIRLSKVSTDVEKSFMCPFIRISDLILPVSEPILPSACFWRGRKESPASSFFILVISGPKNP